MIIYEKQSLENLQLLSELRAEKTYTGITQQEFAEIAKAYPVNLYSPNIFVRIGLFLLTTTIVSCSAGLLTLIFGSILQEHNIPYALILFGIACYAALEIICKKHRHFRAGTDDALSILSWIFLLSGIICLKLFVFKQDLNPAFFWEISLYTAVISFGYTLRFANRVQGFLAYLALLITLLIGIYLWITTTVFILNFTALLFGIPAYIIYQCFSKNPNLYLYRSNLRDLQCFAIITIGLACSYYSVSELGTTIKGRAYQVPFGFLLWAWTFIFPLACMGAGLQKHSRVLLRSGLLLSVIAAVFGYRHFLQQTPIEYLLCFAGAALILLSWRMLIWLKKARFGLISKPPFPDEDQDDAILQSIVISASVPHAPQAQSDRFGGGGFGGGGSSSDF